MEIKYRRTDVNKYVGRIFLIISAVYLVLFFISGFVFLHFIPFAMFNAFIGSMCYFIHYRNYIVIKNNKIRILSNMFFITEIQVSEINKVSYESKRICIYYLEKKKYLQLRFINEDDLQTIQEYFSNIISTME